MKNKIAHYLKIGSIVLFVLATLGAIISAQKEEITYEKKSYSNDYGYKTNTVFDGGMFFATLVSSAIGCSLIYAFGELVDLTAKNNELLEQMHKSQTVSDNVQDAIS